MTPERFGLLVAESALADGVPLGAELQRVLTYAPHPGLERASGQAASGELKGALASLQVDESLAELATLWPKALGAGRRALERLPGPALVRQPLALLALYWVGVFALERTVQGVLLAKVLPVFEQAGAAGGLLELMRGAGAFIAVGGLLVWAVGIAWAVGWPWLPGWPRWHARARRVTLALALVESGAPAETVAAWLRGTRGLEQGHGTVAEDLRAIAADCAAHTEAHAHSFVVVLRLTALSLLVVQAAALLIAVTGALAHLPGTVP